MREGREPLRTFGDLKQFFEARMTDDEAPARKPPDETPPSREARPRQESPEKAAGPPPEAPSGDAARAGDEPAP
jgi:hypothetical protein